MDVDDIHLLEANTAGWVLFIEGIAEGFTNIPELAGTGASSWIGTAYGARSIKLGLRLPAELPLGESDPWSSTIRSPAAVAFTLLDFDGSVCQLFIDYEPDETTDTLGGRISPLDDPAPDPAIGLDGELIIVWDRHVGIERIGPEGERRYFWICPDDVPPGLDHFGPIGWPPSRVTDAAADWSGRKVALYRVVQDPDDGTWPSWQEQYDGGSLWWYGTLTDRGEWKYHRDETNGITWEGRAFVLYAHGPSSWTERAANLTRPTQWYKPEAGLALVGDELLVSVWIEPLGWEDLGEGDGIGFVRTVYDSRTLRGTGNTLAGLTTATEIWTYIKNMVYSMVDGSDNGAILGADNAGYIGPGPLGDVWNGGGAEANRKCRIADNGQIIEIRCEDGPGKLGFRLGICADARVFQLAGWDINAKFHPHGEFQSREFFLGACPVGGANWGEAAGDEIMPTGHVVGLFSTKDEQTQGPEQQSHWDNDGAYRTYQAPWLGGVVILDQDAPTEVFVAPGEVPCEGQHGNGFTIGAEIDGVEVDTAGWWIFRGMRLTALDYLQALAIGEEPEATEYAGVAFCEWVRTLQGDAVEVNSDGMATIRIVRWEDPQAFGLPFDPLEEPWCNVVGALECAPLGVIGGVVENAPGWRHRVVPTILLSSGTASWDTSGDVPTITPGVNQPGDIPGEAVGDIEVADLGCGLPAPFVDWESFYRAATQLPGGVGGALNRVLYVLYGSEKLSTIMRETMAGAGWAWSLKRATGGKVHAFGAYDPVKPIAPDEVEVTLTRADMAELAIGDGPQWRGQIELRRGGPYDRFTFEVGKSPIDIGEFKPYVLTMESNDPGRRHRAGRIDWPVKDTGLRNPAPWLGTPKQGTYDWTELARDRFASSIGPRLAKQQRIYRAVYNARFAHRLGLGTAVHVVDSTAEAPDGTRGINHRGRVIEASIVGKGTGACSVRVAVELERKNVDDVHVWGPFGVSGVEGFDDGDDIVTLSFGADFAIVENDWSDTTGFEQPDWDSHDSGVAVVYIAQSEDGQTYPGGFDVLAEVAAVDAMAGTIELTNIVGTLYEDTVKLVWISGVENIAPWVLAIFAPVCNPNGTSDGVTKGIRLK